MFVVVGEPHHQYVCGGLGDTPTLFVVSPKPPLFVVVGVWRLGSQTTTICCVLFPTGALVVVWEQNHNYLCGGVGPKLQLFVLCFWILPQQLLCLVAWGTHQLLLWVGLASKPPLFVVVV